MACFYCHWPTPLLWGPWPAHKQGPALYFARDFTLDLRSVLGVLILGAAALYSLLVLEQHPNSTCAKNPDAKFDAEAPAHAVPALSLGVLGRRGGVGGAPGGGRGAPGRPKT
jgi:hypothetical protein